MKNIFPGLVFVKVLYTLYNAKVFKVFSIFSIMAQHYKQMVKNRTKKNLLFSFIFSSTKLGEICLQNWSMNL